ncbi:MAG: hypothetical protein CVV42_12460, partial [Candidatus Riflebacteria bacterium HGW-Riflebacteria-2]
MKLRTSGLFYSILVLLLLTFAGDTAFTRDMPIRRVPLNDEMGLLDDQMAVEVKRISQLLYRDFKSEMAVLIIRSTDGVNHNDYALRVFNHWTLGQAGIDNGMLILFAIDDRRVEIMPGTRYKSRFNSAFCNSLMTSHVVPEMKAGRPAQGVLVAAREVAAEIRRIEEGNGATSSSSVGESTPGTSQSSSSTGSKNYSGSSRSSRSSGSGNSGSSGYDSSSASSYTNPFKNPIVRFILYILMAIWIAGGIFYYYMTFSKGTLLMSPWLFILLMLLSGFIIAVVASKAFDIADNTLDQVASGSGGASLLGFLWCFSHICPRCNKYMNVHKRTLHYATYYSSGLGEKTEHCDHCGYHRVSTYTIPRKTRSSSSSSSSGGGGRSSGG